MRPGQHHPRRPQRRVRVRSATCVTCSRTSITAELAEPPSGLDAPFIHDLDIEGTRVHFDVDTDALDEALRLLTRHGVRSMISQPPTLEELFLRHYAGNGDTAIETASVAMSSLVGTGALIRLALRRDRLTLPIWIVVLGVMPASIANAYETFYPSAADRAGLTATIGRNPSVAVIYGPAFDLSTARRVHGLAHRRVPRRVHRADGHLHRDPPQPGGGGQRPGRAAGLGRRRS